MKVSELLEVVGCWCVVRKDDKPIYEHWGTMGTRWLPHDIGEQEIKWVGLAYDEMVVQVK